MCVIIIYTNVKGCKILEKFLHQLCSTNQSVSLAKSREQGFSIVKKAVARPD